MNMRRGLTALLTSSVAVALMSCGSASPVTVASASPTVASASPTVAPELSPSSLHTLLVTGTGMVSAPPNQVVIGLGANAEAASAPLAMTQANADMARLLASLRRQGVQPADISTTELSLYRGYNEPYQASQSVDVTIHHIANAGTVIAAAMNAVGNDATVSGVTYSIHDPSSEIAAARKAAMANSRVEALQLAQLSGHSIGAVLSVSDEARLFGIDGRLQRRVWRRWRLRATLPRRGSGHGHYLRDVRDELTMSCGKGIVACSPMSRTSGPLSIEASA